MIDFLALSFAEFSSTFRDPKPTYYEARQEGAATGRTSATPEDIIRALDYRIAGSQSSDTGALSIVLHSAQSELSILSMPPLLEQLEKVKESFNFNRSQLAKILDVSRPQLNRWLNGDVLPQKSSSNQKIAQLYGFLQRIPEGHARLFGKLAKTHLDPHSTILDVISSSSFSAEDLDSIYNYLKPKFERLGQKLKSAKAISDTKALSINTL